MSEFEKYYRSIPADLRHGFMSTHKSAEYVYDDLSNKLTTCQAELKEAKNTIRNASATANVIERSITAELHEERNQLKAELKEAREIRDRSNSCTKQCEATAYQIETRRLKTELTASKEQIAILNDKIRMDEITFNNLSNANERLGNEVDELREREAKLRNDLQELLDEWQDSLGGDIDTLFDEGRETATREDIEMLQALTDNKGE